MPFGLCPGVCLATGSWALAGVLLVGSFVPNPFRRDAAGEMDAGEQEAGADESR